jgi:hypothetical protein
MGGRRALRTAAGREFPPHLGYGRVPMGWGSIYRGARKED